MNADVAPLQAASVTPTIAPSTPTPERNWLEYIGNIMGSTAAGLKGDPDYMDRIRARETQIKREAEKMQIEKHGMALKVWEEILKASKTVSDPKIAAMMAESFSNTLGVLGQKYSKEDIANAIHNPKLIDDILRRHKDLGRLGLSAQQMKQYDEDLLFRERVDKQADKIWGAEMYTALLKGKDRTQSIGGEEKKLSELTWEQLSDLHPDVARLTEEHKWQLNEAGYSKIKPKELIAAEKKKGLEKPRNLQRRSADLGDVVLQETFDPETGEIIESKTIPKGRVPKEAKEPTQAELIAEELSARREGKKPGSGHRAFRGLSDEELTNQLKKAMNPVDQAIAELMKSKEGTPSANPTQPAAPPGKKKGTYKVDGVYRYWDGEKWR